MQAISRDREALRTPYADLHIHSTASDGTKSPATILQMAFDMGLHVLAITDHDSLLGAREACGLAQDMGLEVVPGVEITTQTDRRAVHLLGYFVKPDSKILEDIFQESCDKRLNRTLAIADNLAEAGYDISSEEVLETGDTVNRSLLARMLVAKGVATSIDDAFRNLIGWKSPYYVHCSYLQTIEAIHAVIEAGGCAFLAHPAHYRVEDLIEPFSREGLCGIEVFHTLQSKEDSVRLESMARELGLGISGGSDWHGDAAHGAQLASAGLDAGQYEQFIMACGRA